MVGIKLKGIETRSRSEFWAEQGCVLQQPYDLEVGAGTMHPDTFLRSLGPEPWNVAYVQPSRRPADARYGENPFRLGKHYQFQVILKPSPKDVQRLYISSLEALDRPTAPLVWLAQFIVARGQ